MKKITLILFMVIGYSGLSQNLSIPAETWKSKIVPVFQGLDKARIPNGILLDYAMDFTDVSVYNGNINST